MDGAGGADEGAAGAQGAVVSACGRYLTGGADVGIGFLVPLMVTVFGFSFQRGMNLGNGLLEFGGPSYYVATLFDKFRYQPIDDVA